MSKDNKNNGDYNNVNNDDDNEGNVNKNAFFRLLIIITIGITLI